MFRGLVGRAAALLGVAAVASAATTIVVKGTSSHPIPPLLYGQMFEDINSGDGGLYAELLQNRAFQAVKPGKTLVLVDRDWNALQAWAPVNGGNISVVADSVPVSAALPNALQLNIPGGASGTIGFANQGYWGINVNSSWTYNASFYYRFPTASGFNGSATIALQGTDGQVHASTQIPISGSQTKWAQVTAQLTPSSTPSNINNTFTVTFDSAAGSTINFAMFSLFPPTFKDKPNGMRADLSELLLSMKPSFFRLPGGNNLEGQSAATRWIWNNTVGDLVDRPGRMGNWGYTNTDGLGLLEYLTWCEDMDMQAIMAVWAGYSLGDNSSVPEAQLQPYIQQAIDQINFAIGDPSKSSAAGLRASLGHPDPFLLTYVEVGNEDMNAPDSYHYRWHDFVTALSSAFPQLNWFAQNSFSYDNTPRNGVTYFQGEYAVTATNASAVFGSTDDGRLTWPIVQGSIGEAVFLTGFERNADITPNLVGFDAGAVYPSTSFYVQQLFSRNKGTDYLPSTLPTANGTLFWSVTSDKYAKAINIKVVNYAGGTEDINFQLSTAVGTSGQVTVLTGDPKASNTPANPTTVVPTSKGITVGQTFSYTAPAWSLSVINIPMS
ncbi:glycoside hydrolase family 51 protein [Coniophora puteana RWD-64-598 SS2]|uniref:non-reducing end alpha-L-arabinofuranosidase n=1 Tax=Coniophora puteana (strain RWD-64-598) TaxID=741705 RepID=A0A5M3N4E0_CONPW|nr:glycoside hydrolase family 51 protein [Coniophora puteana RWD-64-598 SS2]EIW86263.1 glycoside hydrolase family 51 protein [Coniophora puteana RWD-64-598 SS2]